MNFQFAFFDPPVPDEKKQLLAKHFLNENIQRCKIFASVVIVFEVFLILMNITSIYKENQGKLVLYIYLILYVTLLVFSSFMLLYIRFFEKKPYHTELQYKRFQIVLFSYVQFFLIWGSVVTLVDQKEYGNVMAFVVNFMISILFHASSRTLFFLYIMPISVLFIGLPMVQTSNAIVMGHYINLTVFLMFCWLTSRLFYKNNSAAYLNKLLLIETNDSLAAKIEENEKMNLQLENLNKQLRKLTIIDELTNIPNRRGFQQYIYGNLTHTNRKRILSIMMVDIDNFKLFNDHYGHLEGDRVIRTVAQKIQECMIDSSTSMAARFGGEEFVVAVFDLDGRETYEMAEEIRKAVMATQIPHEYSSAADYVTISIGLAIGYVNTESDSITLLKIADQALYKAKSKGKNRVEKMGEGNV